MGKMIDAQSIVVASTTGWYGHEGDILRYVFFDSIALACLRNSGVSDGVRRSIHAPRSAVARPVRLRCSL